MDLLLGRVVSIRRAGQCGTLWRRNAGWPTECAVNLENPLGSKPCIVWRSIMRERTSGKFTKGDPNPGRGLPKSPRTRSAASSRMQSCSRLIAGDRLRKNKDLKLTAEDGVVAYLEHVALTEPKAFLPLLAKVLPLKLLNANRMRIKPH